MLTRSLASRTEINSGLVSTFTYDAFGNLLRAARGSTAYDYIIDGQNRRIGKKKNGVLVQCFLYKDKLAPVAELDAAGAPLAVFVYGAFAHVPDSTIRSAKPIDSSQTIWELLKWYLTRTVEA